MAAQGLPRATRDLDLFVAPRAENIEALKRALRTSADVVAESDELELTGVL